MFERQQSAIRVEKRLEKLRTSFAMSKDYLESLISQGCTETTRDIHVWSAPEALDKLADKLASDVPVTNMSSRPDNREPYRSF